MRDGWKQEVKEGFGQVPERDEVKYWIYRPKSCYSYFKGHKL